MKAPLADRWPAHLASIATLLILHFLQLFTVKCRDPPGQLACEYRAPVPGPRTTSHPHGIMACEYRRPPQDIHGQLACEYRQNYPAQPEQQIACEYRADPRFNEVPPTKTPAIIRTYLPTIEKKKIPLGLIIAIAIAVPILIIVILFGAVWLQELGIL